MSSIALVFFTAMLDGSVRTGPEFSERAFDTHEQCEEFVNAVADDGTGIDVVDINYEFEFVSFDGLIFYGGCYTGDQYREKFLNNE